MNKREKILASLVLFMLFSFAFLWGFHSLWLKPLRTIDQQTALLYERLQKLNADRRAYFASEDFLKEVTQQSFDLHPDQASAKLGELLTRQIIASGLNEGDFTRLPVGPRRLRGGATEVGWSIQGEGRLPQLVNFLYLLENTPALKRLENVSISSSETPGIVRLRVRFLTLVINPAPLVTPRDINPDLALDQPKRLAYDTIIARDILRPYVKRPAPTPRPESPRQAAPAPPAPGPETFRVVSLSQWNGAPEVHVRDLTQQKTLILHAGDSFADGEILGIDYRPRPSPAFPELLSHSRLILKIDGQFFAVERGRTFADKYLLDPGDLPDYFISDSLPNSQ